jgi:DNA mismatch repair ATPase MutL
MEQFQEAGFGFEQENKDKGQVEFFEDGDNEEFQKVFQASKAFIVAEREHGFYWYHQHLMHWSILYNDYLNSRDNSSTQTLLFPIEISDSPKRTAIILESKNLLERLGYILNQVEGKLYCTGVPNEMQEGEVLSFVNEFIEIVGHGLVADELEKEALKLATKKMAVRRGVMLTVPEMVDLLIRFVQQGEENRSPDGRKIFFVTDFEWMLKQLE